MPKIIAGKEKFQFFERSHTAINERFDMEMFTNQEKIFFLLNLDKVSPVSDNRTSYMFT